MKKEKQEQTTVLVNPAKSRHTTNRTHKQFLSRNKYVLFLGLILILSGWVYYVPPSNSIAVVTFIILLSCIFSIIASHLGKKTHVFSTLFIFIFLMMSYFVGFDLINTLVLLSFIIGLSTLFKATKPQ